MEKTIILIDNGHGEGTLGKCSPDRRLKEYAYCREIAQRVSRQLTLMGLNTILLTPEQTDTPLKERVRRANAWATKTGAQNCVLVSIHVNAAASDDKWHDAHGFSVFVSKNASANSKKLAGIFTDLAKERGLLGNRAVPTGKYWTWNWTNKDIYILKNTSCPAVLTENLFQDNREDVNYMLSDEGKRTVTDLHVQAILKYINSI